MKLDLGTLMTLVCDTFTPGQAQRILDLHFPPEVIERLDYLRAGASDGNLSEEDQDEYRDFVEALDVFAMLRAKAKGHLGSAA